MIVQNNIKHINTIGAAAKAAAANPIVCRGLILFCTHCFLGLAMLYIYIISKCNAMGRRLAQELLAIWQSLKQCQMHTK